MPSQVKSSQVAVYLSDVLRHDRSLQDHCTKGTKDTKDTRDARGKRSRLRRDHSLRKSKKWSLSKVLKRGRLLQDVSEAGKEFHTRAALAKKERPPSEGCSVRGMTSAEEAEERRRERPVREDTGRSSEER